MQDYQQPEADSELQMVVDDQQREAARWQKTIDFNALIAGNMELTFRNADGRELAYRIRRVDDAKGIKHFADAMTPDGWKYLGIFNAAATNDEEILFVTRGSNFYDGRLIATVFRRMMTPLVYGFELPEGYELSHSGTCPCCGRKLTSERSLAHGIGPVCEKKVSRYAVA